jgi:tRNA1(Val) A37 N6-methylase TrmN6
VLGALANEFGAVGVLPVLPRASSSAIRVLVRAAKGETAVRLDYPALVLNDDQGRPTVAAEAILRSGETLPIAAI